MVSDELRHLLSPSNWFGVLTSPRQIFFLGPFKAKKSQPNSESWPVMCLPLKKTSPNMVAAPLVPFKRKAEETARGVL